MVFLSFLGVLSLPPAPCWRWCDDGVDAVRTTTLDLVISFIHSFLQGGGLFCPFLFIFLLFPRERERERTVYFYHCLVTTSSVEVKIKKERRHYYTGKSYYSILRSTWRRLSFDHFGHCCLSFASVRQSLSIVKSLVCSLQEFPVMLDTAHHVVGRIQNG